MRNRFHPTLAVAAVAFLLAACGGGGSSTPAVDPGNPQTPPPAATSFTLTGVAATGRPFSGALVTVYDSAGTSVGNATVSADGSWSVSLPAAAAAPLVIEATRDDATLVSTVAEAKDSTANITPLTNLIAARLAPDGNPLSLRSNAAQVTVARLAATVQEVKRIVAPLLTAVGDETDPITGTFAANGTGHDQVLDALDIQIHPAGGTSNIEVTARTSDAQPVHTTFSSDDAAVQPLPPVNTATLPPVGVGDMVEDLMRRITACFALPLDQRVRGAGSPTANVVGTAADLVAPECRSLFVGDDPAGYLSNGARVGRDAANNGAFAGLFRGNATGVVFDQGNFEFLRANAQKDVVFSFRTALRGEENFDQAVARVEGGSLKLVGNQYVYDARIRPIMEDREFINQTAASYVMTGYDLFVINKLDASGNPLFARVEVTSPTGQVFTLKPNAGRNGLTFARADGSLTGTSAIGLASQFRNAATAGSPAQFDTTLFFASPPLSDTDLQAIPAMGVWRVEFFHADASKENVVQTYKTISRALTMQEALRKPMPQLTAAARTELQANSNPQFGSIFFGPPSASNPNVVDLSVDGGGDFWTVPAGAQAPTLAQIFGSGPDPDGNGPRQRPSYDDSVTVGTSARTARIACTRLGTADTHCDNSTGVNQFAQDTSVSVVQLFTVSRRQEELSKIHALYFILPR